MYNPVCQYDRSFIPQHLIMSLKDSHVLNLTFREVPGMPKKFQGENSKSATAKARKAEAKAVADARKQKEIEDALWEDNDKRVAKKEQRKVRFMPYFFPLICPRKMAFVSNR